MGTGARAEELLRLHARRPGTAGPRQGRAQPDSRPALSVRRTETSESRRATRYTIDLEGGGVLDQSQSVQGSGGAAGGRFAPSCVRRAMTRRRKGVRHLNVWVSADEALFSVRSWRECAKPRSVSRGLRRAAMPSGAKSRQPHRFRATGDLVPAAGSGDRQDALHRVRALLRQPRCGDRGAQPVLSRLGSRAGISHDHARNETDFGTIGSDILDLCLRFKVLSVAYDPWGRRSSLGRDEAATRNTPYPSDALHHLS